MGFGPFVSPAVSPSAKGKFFSRLTPSAPSSPVSTNGSTVTSPTFLCPSNNPSTCLAELATKKSPTVMKLAAASQKLSLSTPQDHQDQKEISSVKLARQPQDREENFTAETTSSVTMRSPTSRLPPPSLSMDTIIEEESCLYESKTFIANESDRNNAGQVSAFTPRSDTPSESGGNALSSQFDNLERIVDNYSNFTESTNFSRNTREVDRENTSPLHGPTLSPPPARRRRATQQGTKDGNDLGTAVLRNTQCKEFESELSTSKGPESVAGNDDPSMTKGDYLTLSLLPYTRSQSLPGQRSITNWRSETDEMTKAHHKPLTRTASVSSLDYMAERETSKEGSSNKQRVRRTGLSTSMLHSSLPVHVKRAIPDHMQMTSSLRQSPLALHQLKSPQRSPAHQTLDTTKKSAKSPTLSRRTLSYSRSVSETPRQSRESAAVLSRGSSSMRKPAVSPENDALSVNK